MPPHPGTPVAPAAACFAAPAEGAVEATETPAEEPVAEPVGKPTVEVVAAAEPTAGEEVAVDPTVAAAAGSGADAVEEELLVAAVEEDVAGAGERAHFTAIWGYFTTRGLGLLGFVRARVCACR